jgi:hypothetical protein
MCEKHRIIVDKSFIYRLLLIIRWSVTEVSTDFSIPSNHAQALVNKYDKPTNYYTFLPI